MTALGCNAFVNATLSFLVVTFVVFLFVGKVGILERGASGPRRRRGSTPAAGVYPCYGDRVSVSTAEYPGYASILRDRRRSG